MKFLFKATVFIASLAVIAMVINAIVDVIIRSNLLYLSPCDYEDEFPDSLFS